MKCVHEVSHYSSQCAVFAGQVGPVPLQRMQFGRGGLDLLVLLSKCILCLFLPPGFDALSPFPLFLVAVLAEHVGCLSKVTATVGCESGTSAKLVGTSVELVAGCRWNE